MPNRVVRPPRWWDAAIIYEIYPRSFQDADGDGVGDLPGLVERLDYLNDGTPHSLGIDAIWLTPIFPSPLFDFGYDIADYTAIDPVYGTMEDFLRLVKGAHARGIKIIMDLVANHTSHLHPWFVQSRSSRSNDKRDWYVWRDPGADGGPPTNWLSVFGGPAWTFGDVTGQYYLHSFLPQQPDLNWRNRDVREALFDVVRFWTARGVDGFRLDAIIHIAKDEEFRDNPLASRPLPPGTTGYERLLPAYSQNQPIIHEWLQELRSAAEEDGVPRMLVSEIYDLTPEDIYLFHGADRAEMSMSFNFAFLQCDWDAASFRKAVDEFERSLPPGVWPNVVLNNHDQPRWISRHDQGGLGARRARIAAMLLLTLRGAAYLYYGEEIGMRNGVIPRERLRDPVGIRFWPENPGRDPERTPMQWDAGKNAGFSEGTPWLPISGGAGEINVTAQSADPGSLLSLYRSLIWYRRSSPALTYGAYLPLDATPPDTYCYLRDAVEQRILVVLNFAESSRDLDLRHLAGRARIVAATSLDRAGELGLGDLRLRPLEGLALELEPE